jgi:hypothetical protein
VPTAQTPQPSPERLRISSLPVLSAPECALWADQVLALRRHWTRRDPHLPFYTLGMAAYLDAVQDDPVLGAPPYHLRPLRQANNALINTHFAPLLARCCQALAGWSGQAVRCLDEQAALPGFHIHLPHPMFAQEVASRHVDLQYQKVFAGQQTRPDQVLTLTLALSLPAGAGLRLWDGNESLYHPYQLGQMALHSGLMPHQAVLHPQGQDVPRIMLQCHALQQDSAWGLYW